MRAPIIAILLNAVLLCGSAAAYDPYDPHNCNGVDWDPKQPLAVGKVIAAPHANFVKSPYDDDFKAESCPADTDACRKKSYVVTGDLVLLGHVQGAFTCVNFQSPLAKKQVWATGWLPTAALKAIAPNPHPAASDWIGSWYHPGGPIEIKKGAGGKLHIEGGMTVPTARDFHNGDFTADVTPNGDTIAFVDDGNIPFDKTDEGECRVRMQRIGPWLMVEDNGGCGGAGVTFLGLYRRTK
ncbi:MAG TPA: hypothetical protein VFB45_26840 [Pseudolabrys sp.]|nr:hypothetical protein [Pseudolabrys sp.]